MKRLVLSAAAVFLVSAISFAQGDGSGQTTNEDNCYLKWAKKFEERGSEDVPDGTYDDVIVTYRQGARSDCYQGKVEVMKGKITQIWIKQDDGKFDLIDKKYKFNTDIKVVNGISTTQITNDDILINIIFYKKLKPKKPGYQKAPEPKDD
jgi:hypothetical protein